MMYSLMILNLIIIALLVISLAIVLVIVYRKLPQVSNIDVDSLKSEKTEKVKVALIEDRLKRTLKAATKKAVARIAPTFQGSIDKVVHHIERARIKKMELELEQKKSVMEKKDEETVDQHLMDLLSEAEKYMDAEDWGKAEERLIASLTIDPKFIPAYRLLGELYAHQKSFDQAKETMRYVVSLTKQSPQATDLFFLGEIEKLLGNEKLAFKYFSQAVDVEPGNPKYLDLLLEQCILCREKNVAWAAFQKLKEVNPQNNKLEDFREKLREL